MNAVDKSYFRYTHFILVKAYVGSSPTRATIFNKVLSSMLEPWILPRDSGLIPEVLLMPR